MSVCFFVPADQGGGSNASDEGTEPEVVEDMSVDQAQIALQQFWSKVMEDIRKVNSEDFKTQVLPLARIKKIMKLDEDVKMISAEAPMLFAKACEIFIHELTLRAWSHTEDNKRRTLQRNDIAMAISKSDQFDFLIDIVPRHEVKATKVKEEPSRTSGSNDQVQYYFQLAQQHQAALQTPAQPQLILQPSSSAPATSQIQNVQTTSTSSGTAGGSGAPSAAANTVPAQQHPVILQQIVSPGGEVQNVPVQLTQAQLNMLRMQLQNNSGGQQQIIIQQAPQQHQPQIIQGNVISVSQQGQAQPQQVYVTQVPASQDAD